MNETNVSQYSIFERIILNVGLSLLGLVGGICFAVIVPVACAYLGLIPMESSRGLYFPVYLVLVPLSVWGATIYFAYRYRTKPILIIGCLLGVALTSLLWVNVIWRSIQDYGGTLRPRWVEIHHPVVLEKQDGVWVIKWKTVYKRPQGICDPEIYNCEPVIFDRPF